MNMRQMIYGPRISGRPGAGGHARYEDIAALAPKTIAGDVSHLAESDRRAREQARTMFLLELTAYAEARTHETHDFVTSL